MISSELRHWLPRQWRAAFNRLLRQCAQRHLAVQVVDEMDRLLRQQYQRWLPKLLAATRPSDPADPLAPRTIKVTVSATLSRDPAKVARLELQAPRRAAHLPLGTQRLCAVCALYVCTLRGCTA